MKRVHFRKARRMYKENPSRAETYIVETNTDYIYYNVRKDQGGKKH
jgi:hypothetical protein